MKNLEQLRHVQRSFKILGEASYNHQYALMVGLENINCKVAFVGSGVPEQTALAQSYLSISTDCHSIRGCSVNFPGNDLKALSRLILWSRFSQEFVSRYLQLVIPAGIVGVTLLWIGAIVCEQLIVGILPLTWVCFVICPLLALALSWEQCSDSLLS